MTTFRVRRPQDEARRLILDAGASLLAEGGVAAVQVRAVATRVGMTDAGVTYHFGNRDNLLAELLRYGGPGARGPPPGLLLRVGRRGPHLFKRPGSLWFRFL